MVDRLAIAPRSSRLRPLSAVLLLLVFGLVGFAWMRDGSDMVLVTEPVASDYYAAGETVDIRAKVDGDVVAAGESISVSDVVMGDVMAAGQTVDLAGDFRDDIRVAGRTVRISGQVADHVVAAGQTVVFGHESRVGGFVWAAGRLVELEGVIDGDLEAAGQTVMVTGTIHGNAEIDATHMVIGDNAHIHGDLVWASMRAPEIHAGAQIDGRRIERPSRVSAPDRTGLVMGIVGMVVFSTLSLLLLTWLLRVAMPPVVAGAATRLRLHPGRSFGVGVLAMIVAPLAAAIAMVTVIGMPIALVVMLGYVVLLVISVPVALQTITDIVLARTSKQATPSSGARFGFLALAALVFVAMLQIPVVGWFFGLVVVVFGLGALVLRAFRRDYGGPRTTTATGTGAGTGTGTIVTTETAAPTPSPIITPGPTVGSGPRGR